MYFIYNITWCSRNGFERRILKNSIQIILHRLKDPLVRMRIHYFLHQLLFPKIVFYEGSMYRSIQYLFNLIDFYFLLSGFFLLFIFIWKILLITKFNNWLKFYWQDKNNRYMMKIRKNLFLNFPLVTFIKWAWRGFLNKILRRKMYFFCSYLCENANMLLHKHENEVIIRRPSFISIVRAKPLRVEITQLEKFTKLRWFILKFFCRIFYIFNYDLYI